MFIRKKGQSTLEYSLIIAAVVVALIAVMVYVRRSMVGRTKASADSIGRQFDTENGWEVGSESEGQGITQTQENRVAGGDGSTETRVLAGETVTSNEWESFDTGGPGFHGF